jgi:hypothetical protein
MIDAGGCGCVFVVSIAAGVEMNDVGRSVGLVNNERFVFFKNSFQSV